MRAWVVERHGSSDDLSLNTVAAPACAEGSVLVHVDKAGLNFADGIALGGRYQVKINPPFILGSELAGTVVEAASGTGFVPGDIVMAQVASGAFAEYCLVDAARLIRLPAGMDLAQAAALPISYTTAYVALMAMAGLEPGQTVLIHAAAGGVGIAATQLARSAGAHILATAGSAEKCALAAANGADHVFNYREEGWAGRIGAVAPDGIDVIIDPVGGDITLKSLRMLAWGGRLMLVGFASGDIPSIPANRLLVKAASAQGVFWSFDRAPAQIAEIQRNLVELCARGEVRPLIGGLLPMEDLKAGMASLESGQTTGKIILDVATG